MPWLAPAAAPEATFDTMLAVPPTSEDAAEARKTAPTTEATAQVSKAIRGIAEEHFMRVQSNPFGPHPARYVAAEAGCQPLRNDQPKARHDREGRRRSPNAPPRRYRSEPES